MENNYVLILNITDKTNKIYKRHFITEGYEIIIDEKNTILAKKENNKNVNIANEKAIVDFIKNIANRYEQYGIIYIDLTKVINEILNKLESIENVKSTDQNITVPVRQAIMCKIREKKHNFNK